MYLPRLALTGAPGQGQVGRLRFGPAARDHTPVA